MDLRSLPAGVDPVAIIDGNAVAAGLLAVRWVVGLQFQPHWRMLLGPAWPAAAVGLGVVLAWALVPGPVEFASSAGLVEAVALEVVHGAIVGVLVSLPAYGLLGAARVSADALGTARGAFASLCLALAACAALGLGLHRPALVAARDHAMRVPPGDPLRGLAHGGDLLPVAVAELDGLLVVALSLATPVLLAATVTRLAWGSVGRGPAVAKPLVDVLGPALAAAAGLLAWAASWAAYPQAWARAAIGSGQGP